MPAAFFWDRARTTKPSTGGLLAGLDLLTRAGAKSIKILTDSQIMERQVNGRYGVKSIGLKPLFAEAQQRLAGFERWEVQHIPRERNEDADRLATYALNARRDVVLIDDCGFAKLPP